VTPAALVASGSSPSEPARRLKPPSKAFTNKNSMAVGSRSTLPTPAALVEEAEDTVEEEEEEDMAEAEADTTKVVMEEEGMVEDNKDTEV